MTNSAYAEWQLVSIITTGSDATLKVYVWRQLRRLGALYLHKSVCLLPNRPEVRAALHPILLAFMRRVGPYGICSFGFSALTTKSEADLERFKKWLAAISAREYFHAPAGVAARAAVRQCSDALARFEAALAAEFGEGETASRHNSHAGLTVVEDGP